MSLLKSVLLFLTNQATQFISRGISCSYYSGNFLPSFLLWYDRRFQSSQWERVQFYFQHCLLTFGRSNFFQLKAKYPIFHFLDLYGTIFNLILLKISKKYRNFHRFLKFSLFYPNYDFRILVQIYQSVVQFDQAWLTQTSVVKMLSRRCQNSQKSENNQTPEVNSRFFSKIC